MFFLFASSNPVHAESSPPSMDIEEGKCVFGLPNHWKMGNASEPFDSKIYHEERNSECGLIFASLSDPIEKDDLAAVMVTVAEQLYGEEFWTQPNYIWGKLNDTSEKFATLVFVWDGGDKLNDVVMFICQKGQRSFSLIHLVDYQDKDNVDHEEVFEFLLESCLDIAANIECIEK